MRKAIIRTTLALAIIGGVGVVNSGGAQALPEEIACHHDYLLGIDLCALATHDDESALVLLDGNLLDAIVGQELDGDETETVARLLLGGDDILTGLALVNRSDTDGDRFQQVATGLADPGNPNNFTTVELAVGNDSGGPDAAQIQVVRTERDENGDATVYEATAIQWQNGECQIVQNGVPVAPCFLQVVPQMPYIPYVWLP